MSEEKKKGKYQDKLSTDLPFDQLLIAAAKPKAKKKPGITPKSAFGGDADMSDAAKTPPNF